MNAHRFARHGLISMGFLIAASALTGVGCGGKGSQTQTSRTTPPQPEPDQKKDPAPPTILSPRAGDIMGAKFKVAGTYGNSGIVVTVDVTGKVTGSDTQTTNPDWTTKEFGPATEKGSCTAKASVPGSTQNSVTFTVDPGTTLIPGPITVGLPSPPGTAKSATMDYEMTVNVTSKGPAPAYIKITLYKTDGSVFQTQPANLTMGDNWQAIFPLVPAATYAVSYERKVGTDPPTTTSVMYKVQ